jgi:gas vesicle protein
MAKSTGSYMNGKGMAAGTLGFLVASSIGAALGVLFAPKAGVETRGELAEKARQMAWRFKRNRAELQDSVKKIFGKISDELEQAYLQVRGEVMAQMDALDPAENTKAAYRDIVKSAVTTVAKGKKWTKAQTDKFVAHLEGEYEEPKNSSEA